MRLTNGKLWPIPIIDVSDSILSKIDNKEKIVKDKEGFTIAILRITDIWQLNLLKEAKTGIRHKSFSLILQ